MPDWKQIITDRLSRASLHPADEAAVVEELAQHAADRCDELISGGMDERAALRAVLAELDNMKPVADSIAARRSAARANVLPAGEIKTGNPFTDLWRDLRYGLRAIRKSPAFAFFAVLTLALGIGANTTVFTVINTMLLHPLPVHQPARLVALFASEVRNAKQNGGKLRLSYPDLKDYSARNSAFTGIAGYTQPMVLTLHENSGPVRIFGDLVTASYFETLGLRPALGRFFLPQEDSVSGSASVAVLSYNDWQQRFSGADVLGRKLDINGVSFTVIGVAPRGFIGISAIFGPDVWLPATMSRTILDKTRPDPLSNRADAAAHVVARLKDGVSQPQAQAQMETIASALRKEYPETNDNRTILVRPITDELYSGMGNAGAFYFGTAVLMAIVGLVLCIACSNVANLLLARAAARTQEIAVRLALGAGRGRLIRQSLAESLLLSALGCLGGLALGYAGCRFIWSFLPVGPVSNFAEPKMDTSVLLFACTVSLATAFLFGLVPALRGSRTDVAVALKEGTRAAARSRRSVSFANILVVAQVAFSFVLLFTATLFMRSIERAYRINPGFDASHLSIYFLNPEQGGYSSERLKSFYQEVHNRVAGLPGVASVSWASGLPFWNAPSRSLSLDSGQTLKQTELPVSVFFTIEPSFFQALKIPLLSGRAFNDNDRATTLPVVILNQELASKYWPSGDALNHRVLLSGEKTPRQIVGIVQTANYTSLGEPPQPCVYVPLRQNPAGGLTLYVRSLGDELETMPAVRREISAIDPAIAVTDSRTGPKIIDQVLFGPRVGVTLLGLFGSLGLLLASVGLYGLMAYSVTRRRNELGVRMALGASNRRVLGLVLEDGMKLVGAGLALGVAGCFLLGRLLSRALFGIQPADPASFAGAALLLIAVALLACYFPARAAGRVDPLIALRDA